MDKVPTKKELLKQLEELKGTLGGLKSELSEVDDKIAKKKGAVPDTTKEEKTDYDKIVGSWIDEETKEHKNAPQDKTKDASSFYDQTVSDWIDKETKNNSVKKYEDFIEDNIKNRPEPFEKKFNNWEKNLYEDIDKKADKAQTDFDARYAELNKKYATTEPVATADESTPTPEPKSALSPEDQEGREKLIETIARKHKGELSEDELEFYFENRDAIYEEMNRQSDGEFGIKAPGISAIEEEETEEFEPAHPEPASPKTLEQKETEFELARRMYLEYKTGSVKNKKDMELFDQHRAEKEKIYQDLKMETVKKLVAEGKIDEAKEFLTKEVELRHAHEIKHGSLLTKLRAGSAKGIEAWDKWGVDKEGATSREQLANRGKRMIKRIVNISLIGLTSSGIVAGIGNHALTSTSALSGGVGSKLLHKLVWGVGLGTAFDYARTTIPKGVNAEKAQKLLKKLIIGGGTVVVGGLVLTGTAVPLAAGLATGTSAAIGYGISKFVKKDKWSEKNIKEKIETTKNKFNPNDLDNLKNWEKDYIEVLKEGEKYRIYRKLSSTAAAVAGSTISLEVIGYTKDNSEEMKQVYGDTFKNFWSGVKKWWSNLGSNEDGDSKPIEINQDDNIPNIDATPAPDQNIEAPTDSQPKAPDEDQTPEQTNSRAESGPAHEDSDKHDEYAHKKDSDHHTKKYDSAATREAYSKVTKGYLGEQGPRPQEEHSSHAKLVHKDVSGYQGRETSGYVGSDSEYRPGEVHQHTSEQTIHRPESISVDEMADRVYDNNLRMILNTPESRAIWENIKDDTGETNVNTFLNINRDDLGSVQIKNLQDYILKVIDEVKLKPQKNESIEDFLSRAFEKASHRPKMLERLQL